MSGRHIWTATPAAPNPQQHDKKNAMTYTFDDIDELDNPGA